MLSKSLLRMPINAILEPSGDHDGDTSAAPELLAVTLVKPVPSTFTVKILSGQITSSTVTHESEKASFFPSGDQVMELTSKALWPKIFLIRVPSAFMTYRL